MKKVIQLFYCLIIVCCIQSNLNAQTPLTIHLNPTYGTNIFDLNTTFSLDNNDSITFEMLKFYLSNIVLYHNEIAVWEEKNSFHLVNYENSSSLKIVCDIPVDLNYNQLKFDIGIDSITNVSGAMGGDLDPTKGMYWTWQSGYVNFKLEGTSNICDSYKNEFQYHVGGYQAPYATLQSVVLPVKKGSQINIEIAIKEFINSIHLKDESHIMSLGAKAVELSELLITMFKIQGR